MLTACLASGRGPLATPNLATRPRLLADASLRRSRSFSGALSVRTPTMGTVEATAPIVATRGSSTSRPTRMLFADAATGEKLLPS